MKENNISDLNTESGKLKCVEKTILQGFNKQNIKDNLSNIITDENILEQAMDKIINNRVNKVSYKLTKTNK